MFKPCGHEFPSYLTLNMANSTTVGLFLKDSHVVFFTYLLNIVIGQTRQKYQFNHERCIGGPDAACAGDEHVLEGSVVGVYEEESGYPLPGITKPCNNLNFLLLLTCISLDIYNIIF